jgi:hypothetical protein
VRLVKKNFENTSLLAVGWGVKLGISLFLKQNGEREGGREMKKERKTTKK